MQRTDKFLIGIVAGIVILVGTGFAVMLLRPRPTYLPDNTPGGVANNYLLAVQRGEYERAYGYLSPDLPGYPSDPATFARQVGLGNGYNSTSSVEVTDVQETGERATVSFEETTFYEGGLFGSDSYQSTFQMRLIRQAGQWRIEHSDSFWAWCLDQPEGCE